MHKLDSSNPGAKENRVSMRITPAQKALIVRAARLQGVTLTEFILENALHAASQLLAEERHI